VKQERAVKQECARGPGLSAASANDDQADAADEGDGAEDRGNGDGARLLVRDLERTEVDVLLFVGEAEASDGKTEDADDDQNEANDGGRFHVVKILQGLILLMYVRCGFAQRRGLGRLTWRWGAA